VRPSDYPNVRMTVEQRAQLQPHLDALELDQGNDYWWEKSNALFIYDDDKAYRIASDLQDRGLKVDVDWVPDPATFGGTGLAFIVWRQ
jgi:hypothetical protein